MKFRKWITSIISCLLAACSLFCGCAPAPIDDLTMPENTAPLFEEAKTPESTDILDVEIPVIHISTAGNRQINSKDYYLNCTVRFELTDAFSAYPNTYTDENGGLAKIRCRGNASFTNPEVQKTNKYSYKIKLDTKADLFGFGESKHWYLINNWRDVSQLRNKLSYDLAATLGISTVDCTWVSLYYNGEYRGLYLLTESVRIDEGRVETTNWEEFAEDVAELCGRDMGFDERNVTILADDMIRDLGWISTGRFSADIPAGKFELDLTKYFDPDSLDLTSGYLMELCNSYDSTGTKWRTAHNVPIMADNPMYLATNKEMHSFVSGLVRDFEEALASPTFHNSKGKHYSEYVDVDSMVDYWMLFNLVCNTEFGYRSNYFYIENGKIVFGPAWDFDRTFGNITNIAQGAGTYSTWVPDVTKTWFRNLFTDPWFVNKCQQRWFSIREAVDQLVVSMDLYREYIAEEAENCFARNGIRKANIGNKKANNGTSFTPTQDYEYMREWLIKRIAWMDESFSDIAPNVDLSGFERSEKVNIQLTHEGNTLERDKLTIRGPRADYLLPPDAKGVLELRITTSHTNATYTNVYANSAVSLGKETLTRNTAAKYSIDLSLLDMREGAVNVLYIPVFRSDGTRRALTSVVIKVTSLENPAEDECVIDLNGTLHIVKKDTEITLPKVGYTREGFKLAGWTDLDGNVYGENTSFTVKANIYLYPKWERTDLFAKILMER